MLSWILGKKFPPPTPPLRDYWVDVHVIYHAPVVSLEVAGKPLVGYFRCMGLRCEPLQLRSLIVEQSSDGSLVWEDTTWRMTDLNQLPRSTRRTIAPGDHECAWFFGVRSMYPDDPQPATDTAS